MAVCLIGLWAGVASNLFPSRALARAALATIKLRNNQVVFLCSQVSVEEPIAQTVKTVSQKLFSHLYG